MLAQISVHVITNFFMYGRQAFTIFFQAYSFFTLYAFLKLPWEKEFSIE
jgi:hypothetical protein